MFNLENSVLFLLTGRKLLAESFKDVLEGEELMAAQQYVINEASDYEILSMMVEEEFPDEKYNIAAEMVLFDKLQEQAETSNFLPEWAGADLVRGLGPVHPLSTSKVVMEHLQESKSLVRDAIEKRHSTILGVVERWLQLPDLTEQNLEFMDKWLDQIVTEVSKKTAAAGAAAGVAGTLGFQKWAKTPAGQEAIKKAGSKAAAAKNWAMGKYGQLSGKTAKDIASMKRAAATAAGKQGAMSPTAQAAAMKKDVASLKQAAATQAKSGAGAKLAPDVAKLKQAAATQQAGVKAGLAKQAAQAKDVASMKQAAATQQAGVKAGLAKQAAAKKAALAKDVGSLKSAAASAAGKQGSLAKQSLGYKAQAALGGVKQAAKGAYQRAGAEIGKTVKAYKTGAAGAPGGASGNLALQKGAGGGVMKGLAAAAKTPAAMAAGGVAAAALAAVAAHQIYKRFLSSAARQCAGMSGDAKTACMKKARAAAIGKEITALKSQAAKCAQTKNPDKCKAAIGVKVQKLQAKAQKAAA